MATETDPLTTEKAPAEKTRERTMNIEWFRLISFAALAFLFGVGRIFSRAYIFFPEDDEEGETVKFVLFGQEHPYIHLHDTIIWKIFGLEHTCSYIDYHPYKFIGSILLPVFTLLMTVFLVLANWRNQLMYENDPENEAARSLCRWSRITTWPLVIVVQMCHLWFVNDPEQSYPNGLHFVGHYIPYALFQLAMAVVGILQVMYHQVNDNIPFGLPAWSARYYVRFFLILTIVYQIMVVSVLLQFHGFIESAPIWAARGGWELAVWENIVYVYMVCILIIPVLASLWSIKCSGDNTSFQMAIQ